MKEIIMSVILFSAIAFSLRVIDYTIQNIIFNVKKDATGYYNGYQKNTIKIVPPLLATISAMLWTAYFAF